MSGWTALQFIFQRYMRLAPTLYASTGVAMIYGYLDGQGTQAYKTFYENCEYEWWQSVVFFSNYSMLLGVDNCYFSVWTISVEMQLYLITIPVVYFYVWEKEYGWIAAAAFFIVFFLIRVGVTVYCDSTGANYVSNVFLTSYCRAPEYGIGIILYMVWAEHLAKKKKPNPDDPPESYWSIACRVFFWLMMLGWIGEFDSIVSLYPLCTVVVLVA